MMEEPPAISSLVTITLNDTSLSKTLTQIQSKLVHQQNLMQVLKSSLLRLECFIPQKLNHIQTELSQKLSSHNSKLQIQFLDRLQEFGVASKQREDIKFMQLQHKVNQQIDQASRNLSEKHDKLNKDFDEQISILANSMQNQLLTKEDRIEVQKLGQKIYILQEKDKCLDQGIKLAQHKIQKFIILQQKEQMTKHKRQSQFAKVVEEKIRKQVNKTKVNFMIETVGHQTAYEKELFLKTSQGLGSHGLTNRDLWNTQPNQKGNMGGKLITLKKLVSVQQNYKNSEGFQCISLTETPIQSKQEPIQEVDGSYHAKERLSFDGEITGAESTQHQKESVQPRAVQQNYSQDLQPNNFPQFHTTFLSLAPSPNFTAVSKNYQSLLEIFSHIQSKLKTFDQRLTVFDRQNDDLRRQKNSLVNKNVYPIQKLKELIQQLKQENLKHATRFHIANERIGTLERKGDERGRLLSSIEKELRQEGFENIRQTIKQLQGDLSANLRDLKGKLDLKANQSQLEKLLISNQHTLKNITDLLFSKADKVQVKKALLFIQSKLKEVILVLSSEQQTQKQALLTKKALKCASCDKEVDTDKFVGSVDLKKTNWDGMPFKDMQTENLGRFGMTSFGTLAKKAKHNKKNSGHVDSGASLPKIERKGVVDSVCF